MELLLGILLGLLVLVVLVVLHELGHAVVARRNGVVVEEFGVGFPPRAWSKKLKNGILLTVNWLPLGGFVRLKGEHDSAKGEGTYGQASFWVKTKIILAGVLINWLTAALLFSLLALVGLPKILSNQVVLPFDNTVRTTPVVVQSISDNSPAERAGLKLEDTIVSIDDVKITTMDQMRQITAEKAGQTVSIQYLRNDQPGMVSIQLRSGTEAAESGYLGVGSRQSVTIHATWSAPILGVATTGQLTYETLSGLGSIIVKGVGGFFGQFSGNEGTREQAQSSLTEVGNSVSGPIGILGTIFPSVVDAGLVQILLLTAIISLTLAVMNILPIPALDGGRWFTMVIFRLLKKDLTKEREEAIQVIGFLVLMLLIILVTWSDIGKFF